MSYRILALSIATLASLPVASAQAQTVYVAPGGVYVANGPVIVTPAPGYGAAGVVAPGYGAPAVVAPGYGAPGVGYGSPPVDYVPPAVVAPEVVAPAAGYEPGGYEPGGYGRAGYARAGYDGRLRAAGYGRARVYAAPPPAYYGEPGYARRGYAGPPVYARPGMRGAARRPPVYAADIAPRPPGAVRVRQRQRPLRGQPRLRALAVLRLSARRSREPQPARRPA